MPFAIRYWRDRESELRYKVFGGIHRPAGWRVGPACYRTYEEAERDVKRINSFDPPRPASVHIASRNTDLEDGFLAGNTK